MSVDNLPPHLRDLLAAARDQFKLHTVVGGLLVSTVDLLLDEPGGLRFETLVFEVGDYPGGDLGDELTGYGQRYATEADATAGHAAMVARVSPEAGAR